MQSFVAKVKFANFKSCFVSIPRLLFSRITQNDDQASSSLLRVTTKRRTVVLSWNGSFSQSDTIEISSLFAQHLDFEDGEEVVCRFSVERVADCEQCCVVPLSQNDWELIESNVQDVENNLMNQVLIVSNGFSFPLWVNNGNFKLYVKVTQVKPNNSLVKLAINTELVVRPLDTLPGEEPLEKESTIETDVNANSVITSILNKFTSIIGIEDKLSEELDFKKCSMNFDCEKMDVVPENSRFNLLRVLPINNKQRDQYELCNTIFVNPDEFDFECTKFGVAKMIRVLSPSEMSEKQSKTQASGKQDTQAKMNTDEEYLRSTYVIVRSSSTCSKGCAFVCDNLRRQMGLFTNSRIFIEKTKHEEVKTLRKDRSDVDFVSLQNKQRIAVPEKIILIPNGVSQTAEVVTRFLKGYCNTHKYLLLSKGTLLRINSFDFLVTFDKNEENCEQTGKNSDISKCFILTSNDRQLDVELRPPVFQKVVTSYGCELPFSTTRELECKSNQEWTVKPFVLGGTKDVASQIDTFLKLHLSIGPMAFQCRRISQKSSALLLCGPKGSGKTVLLNHVCQEFVGPPHYVTIRKIECKAMRGKRLDSLQKLWIKEVLESVYRQPSIMIVEDLDIVASASSKPEESEVEALYTHRVALLFMALIKLLERVCNVFGNQFVVIASCKSKELLHPLLVQSRGRHVFEQIIELLPLTLSQRQEVVKVIIQNKLSTTNDCVRTFDLNAVSRKSEGFLPQDFNLLIDRALHNSASRSQLPSQNLSLNNDDFDAAFTNFVPLSLRNVTFEVQTTKTWKDVGGLSSVKSTLLQTILWPLKYPQVFSKCPIRPQSSVLLFGAPGTGKTLLAEAVAKECGVNFISVKGPELLSKYIGASEQAVRDLFNRARSAKPCILFFDEFDAIAPRRGHDSTGVTDRVVNQVLTQMDGIEALEKGVYILAATSRPDLLDPALLRPGRFDKCLYCPVPDKLEREQILTVLSAKLTLKSFVDFKVIAEKTNDFTGADLQALLYTSQLEALQEAFKNAAQLESENNSTFDKQIVYFMNSIEKGFNRCLPSNQRVQLEKEVAVIMGNQAKFVEVAKDDPLEPRGGVSIGEEHLMSALKTTKPSVNEQERQRYLQL